MKLRTLILAFILLLAIAFIAYEVINETVTQVQAIRAELNEAFKLLEP